MGTLLTIWFAVIGIYCLCVATLRLALKLPAIAIFIILLPVWPFIVAYRNRAEHPIQSKAICWMWSILFVLWGTIIMTSGHL